MTTSAADPVGGHDIGTIIASGLAPLITMPVALSTMNNHLSQIHALLQTGLGPQPNTGGRRAQPPVPAAPPMPPGPQSPPGPTGTPTPTPGTGAPPPAPAPPPGGGSPPPGGGPPSPPGAGGGSGFAPSAGGSGLYDRLYNKAIAAQPILSIPNSLRNEYQSQFNKNAFYTGITGAEGQGEAFGMRIQEDLSRLRYMRLFNKEENEQAVKGLAAMGINSRNEGVVTGRANWRESMDFIYQGKEKYGATIEEGLANVDLQTQNASINLKELSENLDQLSVAAGDAQVSASKLREEVRKGIAVNTAAGMTGYAAQSWAQATAEANLAAGPMFADKSAASRLGTDTGYNAMVGAQHGITPGAMGVMAMTNPAEAAAMQTDTFLTYMEAWFAGVNDEGWAWLEQEAALGVRDPTTIADDFLLHHYDPDPRPFEALVSYANAFQGLAEPLGDEREVIAYIVKEMGSHTTANVLANKAAESGSTDIEGKSVTTGEDLLGDIGGLTGEEGGFLGIGGHEKGGKATDIYMTGAQDTGKRSTVLEEGLLGRMSGEEEDKAMVAVETQDGTKVMSLAEALDNGFEDQITTGRAYFVSGKIGGKDVGGQSISEAADMAVSTEESALAGAEESAQTSTEVGQDVADYIEEHPEARKYDAEAKGGEDTTTAGSGKSLVELGPYARKYFELIPDEDPTLPPVNNNLHGGGAVANPHTNFQGVR